MVLEGNLPLHPDKSIGRTSDKQRYADLAGLISEIGRSVPTARPVSVGHSHERGDLVGAITLCEPAPDSTIRNPLTRRIGSCASSGAADVRPSSKTAGSGSFPSFGKNGKTETGA